MDYQVIVKKYKDQYILHIEELSLIHKTDNFDKGYKEILDKKNKILSDIKEYDLTNKKNQNKTNLKPFFIKTVIIFLGLTFLISYSGIKILTKFNEVAVNLEKEISLDIENKILDKLNSLSEIDADRRDEQLEKIKIIISNLKPYYKEVIKIDD